VINLVTYELQNSKPMKEKDLHAKQKDELKKTNGTSGERQDLKLSKKDERRSRNKTDVANEERTRDISKGRP